MPKTDFGEFADLALELIAENGLPSVLRKISRVEIDPLQPWLGYTDDFVDYPCEIARFSASNKDLAFLPEGTSLAKTKKMLIDAVTMKETPIIGDIIERDENGIEWQIIAVGDLKPADVDVMWTVYVQV